jgi:hypothetical protein
MSTPIQFAVLTQDPAFSRTLAFIKQHSLANEIHLNRTRFWIPPGPILTEFLLRFETIRIVSDLEDLATGRINTLHINTLQD